MPVNEYKLRKDICEIGRNIWQRQFCAGNEGNHSVKVEDDRYLVTPTGISKGFLEPEDICVTNVAGEMIEPNARGRKPSSEIKVHLAIYQHRPDIGAVIHSHPPHATAFAIAGVPLPEAGHPEGEVFLGKVRTAPFAMPSTHDLPNSILPLIDEQTNTVLMGNHGSVSFDADLTGAYYKLEILDAYCRILLLTKQIGKINFLSQEDMKGLLEVKQRFGLDDSRLSCADTGCIGAENEQFLATFSARPMTAACACDGGEVTVRGGGGKERIDEATFEAAVQAITDQIMAGTRN